MLVTLDAKELLAAARLAYDKDQIRSWCKCLLIKVRYDKYTIVGSDGYKLIEFEHNINHDAADVSEKHNADFLLYVEDVKKYLKSTVSCVIRENDGMAHQGYAAWVNADYMADICAAVKLAYGKSTPIQIMMGLEGRAMEFMTSDYNNMRTCFGMVMPVRR